MREWIIPSLGWHWEDKCWDVSVFPSQGLQNWKSLHFLSFAFQSSTHRLPFSTMETQ